MAYLKRSSQPFDKLRAGRDATTFGKAVVKRSEVGLSGSLSGIKWD
jgi:hypothetical protein